MDDVKKLDEVLSNVVADRQAAQQELNEAIRNRDEENKKLTANLITLMICISKYASQLIEDGNCMEWGRCSWGQYTRIQLFRDGSWKHDSTKGKGYEQLITGQQEKKFTLECMSEISEAFEKGLSWIVARNIANNRRGKADEFVSEKKKHEKRWQTIRRIIDDAYQTIHAKEDTDSAAK